MRRYLSGVPKQFPEGVRLVHNFYPGPRDDPGRHRSLRQGGFRAWITDEPSGSHGVEHRCFCGWLDGREHYGTRAWVDEDGELQHPA